ncbi:hypothetical protein TNCV_3169221 [Trichonephila clavipes]|nr:hypothetical protein TNCV_3169221 [Trichonephila clavipes]
MLHPEVVPFLKGIPVAIFQQDNVPPHVAKTVQDLCSNQHIQLLSWPAYSTDLSLIEHVWHLVGRGLARDPRRAASKDKQYGILFHKHTFKICLTPYHVL